MNPTDPYETGFPKKGTYEKIPYHDSVGDLGFRHLSLGAVAGKSAMAERGGGARRAARPTEVAGQGERRWQCLTKREGGVG